MKRRPDDARRVAYDVLVRIERDGAYANLALPAALARSSLDERGRRLATELTYGTTRMRRACDHMVDRFLLRDPDPATRALLRLGAYQLLATRIPPHAAVSATVDLAPGRSRGFVNAVLRRVAASEVVWPDEATRLSYPDWVVERLVADLGAADAMAALEAMDVAPAATGRADGYIQDLASQWVGEAVGAAPGERVGDLCAAPGGKATAMATTGAHVVAVDLHPHRARLVQANADALGLRGRVAAVVADAADPPLRPASFDRVLLDAPCSGLGTLRRRPDARWRVAPADVDALAALQCRLVESAARLVRPGGMLVYAVCTLTAAETLGVDAHVAATVAAEPLGPLGGPWQPYGRGSRLLPQAAGTDGMVIFRYRLPTGRGGTTPGPGPVARGE